MTTTFNSSDLYKKKKKKKESRKAYGTANYALLTVLVMFKKTTHFLLLKIGCKSEF